NFIGKSLHSSFKFTQQLIVCLYLPVKLSPVVDNPTLLYFPRRNAFMDHRLLRYTAVFKTAAVNAHVKVVLLQSLIRDIFPFFAPAQDLLLTVPLGAYGILPSVSRTFRVFAYTLISLLLGFGGSHIHLFLADLVLILLFPAVKL